MCLGSAIPSSVREILPRCSSTRRVAATYELQRIVHGGVCERTQLVPWWLHCSPVSENKLQEKKTFPKLSVLCRCTVYSTDLVPFYGLFEEEDVPVLGIVCEAYAEGYADERYLEY